MIGVVEAPMGRWYEVDGRRLWLHRSGTGGRGVVFLPGASAVGLDYLNVHDRVAEFTTSVLYDRGGTGWSDPVALPRTAAAVAAEVRDLLRTAGVPAPYVLVAHSLGGAYARRYLQLYPGDVAGVVYLDAFWEEWDTYVPENLHIRPVPVPGTMALRLVTLLSRGYYRRMFAAWPPQVREPLIAGHLSLTWQRAGAQERSNQHELRDEIKAAGPVPEAALVALTAMGIDPGMRLFRSSRALAQLTEGKHRLYDALAASVRGGQNRPLARARHSTIHIDGADEVTRAIHDLWQEVS